MERCATFELDKWINSDNRKPLFIRGARQVGKTWLVRDPAKCHNLELIELNLEGNPSLFYWQRTGDRQEEIDYIIQHGARIVTVEVKSGSAGSMKSLHQFMADKKLVLVVRLDLNPPSVQKMNVKTTKGGAGVL